MKKRYINIHFQIENEVRENAIALISVFPSTGIEERRNELIATFEEETWNDELRVDILELLQNLNKNIKITQEKIIDEENWNEEWEKNVPPIRVNDRIGIAPDARINELDTDLKIIINPKMSFGTGHHSTTRLSCLLMEDHVKKDSHWIDVGAGTGVLSILAIHLGAKSVFAFDNSSWAVENAAENFERNNVAENIRNEEYDISDGELEEADGILANLNRNLVMQLMPVYYNSLKNSKGFLICSGFLDEDFDQVVNSANSVGFSLDKKVQDGEWLALRFKV